jgi:hypothetical protein
MMKRLTGLVTRMLEKGNNVFLLSLKLKGRYRLEDVNIGRKKGLINSAIVHFLKITLSYRVEVSA